MLEDVAREMHVVVENQDNDQLEEGENPLAQFRTSSLETTMTTEIPSDYDLKEAIKVAPGEGKQPISILNDLHCEEMAHPHLFPTGMFGYKIKRDIPISPSKYFNQRLSNFLQKYAANSDYIYFARSIIQKTTLNNQISIALRKASSNRLTTGMLSRNFKSAVHQFIVQDKAFSFMSAIKGTPAYWKKFLHEVLSMFKQLGISTFSLLLPCADLQ